MIARGLPFHRVDVAPSCKSTNFTFEYDWRRSVARRLATSSLPPAQPECTPAPFLRFFLLVSSSRRRVVIPFGWLHPLIKPYLVGETARCLSPLLRQSPTSTLEKNSNQSNLAPSVGWYGCFKRRNILLEYSPLPFLSINETV